MNMDEAFFKPEYILALPVYILVILSAIFIHELGHYCAARIFGIPIKDVVIGRGRIIKSWYNKRNVAWQIRLWPTGAHVHLRDMQNHPFYQKILTILAGPIANIIFIPFLFLAFYTAFGQPSIPNRVVGVESSLAADHAGIEPGDRIIATDDTPLTNHDDIWRKVYSRGAVETNLTVQRGAEIFKTTITPGWSEYHDNRGVPRKNARYGIIWQHAGYDLTAILGVNGIDTSDNEDLARQLLIDHFDQHITVTIKGPEEESLKPARIHLSGVINAGLLEEQSDFYDTVFFGATMGNIYMRDDFIANIQKSFRYTGALILNVAKLPFQIFPIDKTAMQDRAAVTNPDTKIINGVYSVMHLFALASIVIAFINLLPFPNLDGGQCLDQILRHIWGENLTNKRRANIFASVFLLLYASIFIANMDNLHGYIDSRLKKVHEFIDHKMTNSEN